MGRNLRVRKRALDSHFPFSWSKWSTIKFRAAEKKLSLNFILYVTAPKFQDATFGSIHTIKMKPNCSILYEKVLTNIFRIRHEICGMQLFSCFSSKKWNLMISSWNFRLIKKMISNKKGIIWSKKKIEWAYPISSPRKILFDFEVGELRIV